MKTKNWLIASILLNVLLLGICISAAVIYRDKLFQKFVEMKGEPTIVMYGNSITAQGKWVELLGRTDVLNNGLPGQTTYHFLKLVKPMVIDHHPKICFIKGGINDITYGVSQHVMQANYQKILETILENGIIPVVTLTLYERDDTHSKKEVETLNAFLSDFCQKHSISVIDLNQSISDSTGLKKEFSVDKTHLNYAAYKIWASEIERVLKENGI